MIPAPLPPFISTQSARPFESAIWSPFFALAVDEVSVHHKGSQFDRHIGQDLAVHPRPERIVGGICAAYGAEYHFKYSREFAATINSPTEAEIATKVAVRVVGADNVNRGCAPIMASEDFGFMLQRKPGCYL